MKMEHEAYTQEKSLYHWGVKGMQWGVRRYQPYPKGKHGTFLGQSRDEDIRIKTGTEAYRLQSQSKLQGSGQTYVSFKKLDHMQYMKATAAGDGGVCAELFNPNGDNGNGNRPYSITMKLEKDIIAPSYQKTMDAFVQAVDSVGGAKKYVKESNYTIERGKEFVKNYKRLNVEECRDRAYVLFTSKFMRDNKAKRIFFNNLQAQGYNAVIDDWDTKFGKGATDAPMLIFRKEDTVRQTKARPLSDADQDYFYDVFWNEGDDSYITSRHGNTVNKWDKWAGSKRYRSFDD